MQDIRRNILEFLAERDISGKLEVTHSPRADADLVLRSHRRIEQPDLRFLADAAGKFGFEISSSKGKVAFLKLNDEQFGPITKYLANEGFECLRDELVGKRILVDFLDPNATKPLHVGHLRSIGLGLAIGCIAKSLGAKVVYQQVVGDVGRATAEMLAGRLEFESELRAAHPEWDDVNILGRCYAFYVDRLTKSAVAAEPIDEPIGREIDVHGDMADEILRKIVGEDTATLDLWQTSRAVVMNSQRATLSSVGAAFDNVIYESDLLGTAGDIRTRVERKGWLTQIDGRFVYETNLPEYPRLTLARSDGFPTEHLRGLAAWSLPGPPDIDAVVHIMGSEWVPATRLRLRLLEDLGLRPEYEYTIVEHEMVTISGSKMKSSGGPVLLIDSVLSSLLDIARSRESAVDGRDLARFFVLLWALSRPRGRSLILDSSDLGIAVPDEWWGWGERIVRVRRDIFDPDLRDPFVRWVLLQVLLLRDLALRAYETFEPATIVRWVENVLRVSVSVNDERSVAWATKVMRRGCELIGLT